MDPSEQAQLRKMREPAQGTLQVVAVCGAPAPVDAIDPIRLTGVLRVAGLPPTAVEYQGDLDPDKWPQRGQLLPVIVDRANPIQSDDLMIDWDRVPTHLELAEQLAEQLRRQGDSEEPPGVGTSDGI